MDAALSWILKKFSSNLLLVDPVKRPKSDFQETLNMSALSITQIRECPVDVLQHLSIILQFTVALLRNSISKSLYASVHLVADLLGAADDDVAHHAVSVLAALSLPPAIHKQQAPEQAVHTTALHQTSYCTEIHERLTETARAWGTRAMGLGLYATVVADDSIHGQGSLPAAMGQVSFCCYQRGVTGMDEHDRSNLLEINLDSNEMLVEESDTNLHNDTNILNIDDADHEASNKRRRVSSGRKNVDVKSATHLFFAALEKVGGKEKIPRDRLFSLLTDIRLARDFHSQSTRVQAVHRRLLALIAILNAHPSHEVMSGFFQAQPELTVEIVDLLRPTVSTSNVSSLPLASDVSTSSRLRPDAISNLVSSTTQQIPYNIRMLALEALTALVSRRDSATGALSGSARLSSVLNELGVGKGQYLGLLPTLIRYSLAALNPSTSTFGFTSDGATSANFEIGMAFAEVTMDPPICRTSQVESALLLIDNVLTLTSTVVGTPTGTPALVDCGLIPALLSVVSLDVDDSLSSLLPAYRPDRRLRALFRFVAAQAVQIIEGTIVSNNNALASFHDLLGVEILTTRLSREMTAIRNSRPTNEPVNDISDDVEMDDGEVLPSQPIIFSSQRVLLFGVVTCLNVVFHHESASSTPSPSGGTHLKKKELTDAVIDILNNVVSFGGHLASLISTLLSEIMNSEALIVYYVHQSGIADAFLKMIQGKCLGDGSFLPILPPVPELVMAIPSVIAGLSLTEEGRKVVEEKNPFPSFLLLFHHPNYAMPKSRCLLNEMTTVVGSGLEDIMRHYECLKPLVLKAIAEAMSKVVAFAEDLFVRECRVEEAPDEVSSVELQNIENERSCLIQYILNFGQLLAQILQNEENCDTFVEAGGLDALLQLFPASMPSDSQFLAYLSSLSSPSVSTLHHSTIEQTLAQALKCIEFRYDPHKLLQKFIAVASSHLDELNQSQKELLELRSSIYVLDNFPLRPLHKVTSSKELHVFAWYLRNVTKTQWITAILSNAVKASSQRNGESAPSWSRTEREWKKELSSKVFEDLVTRLSLFYRSTLFEVCRTRSDPFFEQSTNNLATNEGQNLRYRLRIVCPEGAVVRDGIEIDSCANIGSMEMGDIVDSFDRCINSSGILRYRTQRGWVSEITRGHGREPIAEVFRILESSDLILDGDKKQTEKRIETPLPCLKHVAVGVLARGQACYSDFFGSLSRLALQGVRNLPGRGISFEEGSAGAHVSCLMKLLAANLRNGFKHLHIVNVAGVKSNETDTVSDAGIAMFFSCYLSHAHACLFDDRRETRLVNFTLLVSLLATDPFIKELASESQDSTDLEPPGMFDAMRFVFQHGLSDFADRAAKQPPSNSTGLNQRVRRSVACSYPPLLGLLRKLMSTPFSSSPSASIMSRMKWKDISRLLGDESLDLTLGSASNPDSDSFFSPESFVAHLRVGCSRIVKETWIDPRLLYAPSYLVHPMATLVDEIMVSLKEASKKKSSSAVVASSHRPTDRVRLSEMIRARQDEAAREASREDAFEASEEAISQLMEMGFSREHALDALESTNSNRIETAMDYALSNPPPSEAMIERRRVEREERVRRRTELRQQTEAQRERETPVAEDSTDQGGMDSSMPNVGDQREGNVPPDPQDDVDPKLDNQKESENGEPVLAPATLDLSLWVETVPDVVCNFLLAMQKHQIVESDKPVNEIFAEKDGDGENEALTVVLCSFLLDVCNRHSEKRNEIISKLFSALKNKLTKKVGSDGEEFVVGDESEACVASLCHAAVLITRALPKVRLLLLKEGLVRRLVSCIRSFVSSNLVEGKPRSHFPLWLAPSLLLLDIMAQPIAAFSDEEAVKAILTTDPDEEFIVVQTEHKQQIAELRSMAQTLFADSKPKISVDDNTASGEGSMDIDVADTPFSSIPAFFPLLTHDVTQDCMEICQKLLCAHQTGNHEFRLLPGIAQSTLMLLLRLVRAPKLSSQSLQMGLAEAILSLPHECIFTGNTGLVTLIFRRLLEDEPTLQSAMETEIRGAITKLLAKKSASNSGEKATVLIAPFMESVMPLLCRNPTIFLKALALSVAFEFDNEKKETRVSILSVSDRSKKLSNATTYFGYPAPKIPLSSLETPKEEVLRSMGDFSSTKPKNRSLPKVSKRLSFSKKSKKEKTEQPKISVQPTTESPATQITCFIINAIVTSCADEVSDADLFLGSGSLLEILADLVLAVPACASAVHNYRSHRVRDKGKKSNPLIHPIHAIPDSPAPPKTFISFLLHCLLPQDRWIIKNDSKIWERRKDEDEDSNCMETKMRKKRAYKHMKKSQASARVLMALAARPGEGRKRVIADLVFALSGGLLGHGAVPPPVTVVSVEGEMNRTKMEALRVWGELALGLIAPRSNGKNLDNMSALCIENLRLMLEYGLAHALLFALHHVDLSHPMAPSICSALVLPLEVLTRTAVTDAVKDLVSKDTGSKENVEGADKVQEADVISSEDLEGTRAENELNDLEPENDAAVDFDVMAASQINHLSAADSLDGLEEDEDFDEESGNDDDSSGSEESGEESADDDDEDDDDDDDEESEGMDVDDDDDDNNNNESEMEESDEGFSDEVEEEGGWDLNYNDAFPVDGAGERNEFEDVGEEGTELADENIDEGWTRIEAPAFGGMLLSGRLPGFSARAFSEHDRGFIDAAETMIGTLIRNGDFSGEALAEIEGTLGIRVMRTSRRPGDMEGGLGDTVALRVLGMDGRRQHDRERDRTSEVTGTLPHIHQRSQPDVGYSAFGRGQWVEISSMEYVYGGPSVTGGNRNYNVATPFRDEGDADSEFTLTQLDLHIFPGGPALAASGRTQHSLHPLLCGVDLPPINSLVSDVLPHGVRATRRGQMATRRPGEFSNASFAPGGYLVSTSNGNIIRSNRSHSIVLGGGIASRATAGPVGWTDDGLPMDSAIDEFGTAFQVAIVEAARTAMQSSVTELHEVQSTEPGSANSILPTVEVTHPSTLASNDSDNLVSAVENPSLNEEQDSVRSDGDRVASSLAAGLRLSPESEESMQSDQSQDPNHGTSTINQDTQPSLDTTSDVVAAEAEVPDPHFSFSTIHETLLSDGAQFIAEDSQNVTEMELILPDDSAANLPDRNTESDECEEMTGDVSGMLATTEPSLPNDNGLICPPDIDLEVFNSLPLEMQQDCVDDYNATQELAAQLDGSSLDPSVLAELPPEVRREVIEQERRERRIREQEQAPADPARAADIDIASFIATLSSPELREEVLLTADESVLNTLPPDLQAEARILRERAHLQRSRLMYEHVIGGHGHHHTIPAGIAAQFAAPHTHGVEGTNNMTSRRKPRSGKFRVETDRLELVYTHEHLASPFGKSDVKALFQLLFLLSPIRPPRIIQKLFQNLCVNPSFRSVLSTAFVNLLHENLNGARLAVDTLEKNYGEDDNWRRTIDSMFPHDDFPPSALIGAVVAAPNGYNSGLNISASLLRRKEGFGAAASMVANMPKGAGGGSYSSALPPVVAARLIETVIYLCKSSSRFCLHALVVPLLDSTSENPATCFENLLELFEKPTYSKSAANLDQLLTLLESAVSPLSHITKNSDDDTEISAKEISVAAASGREWVDVPRITVSQKRLQLLCSILRMETCRDAAFTKVNTIVRRLCRVESNRGYVLAELASVAHALGNDALRDLKSLRIRMESVVARHRELIAEKKLLDVTGDSKDMAKISASELGSISSSVTLSTSTSELKLLRVLQTLQALCSDGAEDVTPKKSELVTEELAHLLQQMQFDDLWSELTTCLKVVQILEGVKKLEEETATTDDMESNDETSGDEITGKTKKMRNSAAGLLSRFLPSIEAFFVANASATRHSEATKDADGHCSDDITLDNLVGGKRVMDFVTANKVLLNAIVRNNPAQLDKGLRALVQVPRCRVILDFDVKRHWFRTQMRRLRPQGARRNASLRLVIRRSYVFEDAYHQLRVRNADEMRGRLHVTFRNEEGVDAGGVSREFFEILAKEIFNPNYALFTSTEDGCTFQPNPNSSINPDHLSYFRFVGRIVGKAVADSFCLDAHFTRSLYKHMLGLEPTHHDMEAIDPDYYRNLNTILEYNLADIGLDLTFSIQDNSFGRHQVIDLIPNGRNIPVTEQNKEEYVRKICQHRMTTAIQSQIKAYLDGFYELVSPELIAVFTPRELELLISGLPEIDLTDLKKNTDYQGWKATDKEIEWFWSVLFSLSRNEKASFLQFVTGSSKVPLAGFSELQGMRGIQRFCIHKAGGAKGALMSAHTCFNSLDLPAYSSEEETREKLLYAINEGAGAFLFA